MSELTDFRHDKDEFFKTDHHAPLTPNQQKKFSGLSYFDENDDLKLEIRPVTYDENETIEVQTSTGDISRLIRWAKLEFAVEGQQAQLTLFRDADTRDYFLPFVDATSGSETYGAGRYLEVEQLPNGSLLVDFNYAYNPYCAYNDNWSCPLTPWENRLAVPIRAGEKNFSK